jgi:hypothetical protein
MPNIAICTVHINSRGEHVLQRTANYSKSFVNTLTSIRRLVALRELGQQVKWEDRIV